MICPIRGAAHAREIPVRRNSPASAQPWADTALPSARSASAITTCREHWRQ